MNSQDRSKRDHFNSIFDYMNEIVKIIEAKKKLKEIENSEIFSERINEIRDNYATRPLDELFKFHVAETAIEFKNNFKNFIFSEIDFKTKKIIFWNQSKTYICISLKEYLGKFIEYYD